VLTTRLAHILATRRAWPGQILSVTFTNKRRARWKCQPLHALDDAADQGADALLHLARRLLVKVTKDLAGPRPAGGEDGARRVVSTRVLPVPRRRDEDGPSVARRPRAAPC